MSTPIIGSGNSQKHRRMKAQASYKKDWLKKQNVLGSDTEAGEVVWQGYLFRETDDHLIPLGWCTKGSHYIAWQLRHNHIEECVWRKGKMYGK